MPNTKKTDVVEVVDDLIETETPTETIETETAISATAETVTPEDAAGGAAGAGEEAEVEGPPPEKLYYRNFAIALFANTPEALEEITDYVWEALARYSEYAKRKLGEANYGDIDDSGDYLDMTSLTGAIPAAKAAEVLLRAGLVESQIEMMGYTFPETATTISYEPNTVTISISASDEQE